MKQLTAYVSHNMFGRNPDEILEERKKIVDELAKSNIRGLWLFDGNDFKRDLLPDEIVGRCLGIISVANIFIMVDADKPGWGKMFEMYFAFRNNIPVFCIWQKKGPLNQWIEYFATEIFDSLDSLIVYLKNTYYKNT